jgi:DNA-binding NtrC family response regulator
MNVLSQYPILVVDDERHSLTATESLLMSAGFRNIICCQDSTDVQKLLDGQDIGVMVLDLTMPVLSGEDVLDMVTQQFPKIPVIILTGKNDIDTAVECMRNGAFDYLVKPVDGNRLVADLERAIELRQLAAENEQLRDSILSDGLKNPDAFSEILTQDSQMYSIFRYLESVANSPKPVLITGETGVGKELIARSVHAVSGRTGEFVSVNIAGLTDTVFDDTLFGHVKGAFTGADQKREGLIEKAAGGTVFLDEIGDMEPASQLKLLRLLQEREFLAIGSDLLKRTDAAFVFATNHELESLVRDGRFRRDLFYRIQTHHVQVPPLRERKADIPVLAKEFIREASLSLKITPPAFAEEVLEQLLQLNFAGNIRELEGILYDAVAQSDGGQLHLAGFSEPKSNEPTHTPSVDGDGQFKSDGSFYSEMGELPTLKVSSDLLIDEAMRRAAGNQAQAARSLGISASALSQRLRKRIDAEADSSN